MKINYRIRSIKNFNLYVIVSLLVLLVTSAYSQEEAKNSNNFPLEEIDGYVKSMVDSLQIVGLNYAILIDNELVHIKSFGFANAQLHTPLSVDHVFPVASISKLFSSIALHELLMVHNRCVDETVADFLPDREDLPESWRRLTLKQLLSHTSGMPDQIEYQIYLAPESEQYVIESMKNKPFDAEPGTLSKYNATAYLLVRIIIEELSNMDFESYMKNQFFARFGLSSAQYGGFKKVVSNRVTCYQNTGNGLEMFPLNYSSPMYAGAGLNINIFDLIKWFQALQDEKIVTKDMLDQIWTPVKLNNGENAGFGLGWEAYELQGGFRMVGHGGAGISSFMHYWNKETRENVTVILLTNGANHWTVRPNQINYHIATMILSE